MGKISQTKNKSSSTTKDQKGVCESCRSSILYIKTSRVATPQMMRVDDHNVMTDDTRRSDRLDGSDRKGKPF
jgi:hypothetical protein